MWLLVVASRTAPAVFLRSAWPAEILRPAVGGRRPKSKLGVSVADVFMSYSRRDASFVKHLADELRARGKEVFVDVDGLRDAEVFPQALQRAIEGADAFLFVISPDSVTSRFCGQEVEHASELNKRIVPIALRPVPDAEIPQEIRDRNWIAVPEHDGSVTDRVVGAIETDLEWEKQHTRLMVRALEWDAGARHSSSLLRGPELAAAERWLAEGLGKDRGPTDLQQAYLLAGRRAAARRQRTLGIVSLAIAAISLVLVVFALISRSDAVNAEAKAKSQAYAADSANQLSIDPELSVLLGIRGVSTQTTPQAMFALRAALDASPIRARLPAVGHGNCLVPGERAGAAPTNAPTVAFSPDGRQLAEGLCLERQIRIADALTGRLEHVIRLGGPGEWFTYADQRTLVADPKGRLERLDADTGQVIGQGPAADAQAPLALDPRAPVVAASTYTDIVLWNLHTGAVRRLPLTHDPTTFPAQIAFSPDGRRLAVATTSNGPPAPPGVMLLDAATGRVVAVSKARSSGPVTGGLSAESVAFSPDGRRLYAGDFGSSSATGALEVLDARTLRPTRTLRTDHLNSGQTVSVSPDGTRIAYGFGDGSGGVMTAQGQELVRFPRVNPQVGQIALDPTRPLAAETSPDGQVRILSAVDPAELTIPPVPDISPGWIGLSGADASHVDTLNGSTNNRFYVDRWTTAGAPTGAPLQVAGPSDSVAAGFLSDDGHLAFVQYADRHDLLRPEPIRIWDVAGRRVLRTLPATLPPNYNQQFFLPGKFIDDDRLVAITVGAPHNDFRDELINVRTGAVRVLITERCGQESNGSQVAASRDGRVVGFLDTCGYIRLFDTATGHQIGHTLYSDEGNSIAIDNGGRHLASSVPSGAITIWNIATDKPLITLSQSLSKLYFLVFSPNGHYLASAGQDHTVRIWDDRTWNELRVIDQPQTVFQVLFAPDSASFFTQDDTAEIQRWDTCTDCENPAGLLALGRSRVTRSLTPQERREFAVG